MDTKVCTQCKVTKPLTQFHRRGARHQSICKSCRALKSRLPANPRPPRKTTIEKEIGQRVVALEQQISKIAYQMAKTAEEAEDIRSSINEYLLTHMRPEDPEERYLATARLQARHEIAKTSTYTFYVGSEDELGADKDNGFEFLQSDQPTSLEDEIIHRQQVKDIHAVINTLSPKNQQIVSMLYAGLRPSQIAIELNVSRAAVSMSIDRIELQFKAFGLQPA